MLGENGTFYKILSTDDNLREDFPDLAMQGEGSPFVHWRWITIDKYKMLAMEIMHKGSGKVNGERGTCNDEHIGVSDGVNAFVNRVAVELLLIEYDIRLDETAAAAAGNACG